MRQKIMSRAMRRFIIRSCQHKWVKLGGIYGNKKGCPKCGRIR